MLSMSPAGGVTRVRKKLWYSTMFLCTRLYTGSSTRRGILSPYIWGPENQEVLWYLVADR
jgi:hypothetical protein